MGKLPTTKNLMELLHSLHMKKEKIKPMFRLKVKEIAEQKSISQRQLFFSSGVDIKTIQRIYRYPTTTVVTVATLARLAQVLEVDISELVESGPGKLEAKESDEAIGNFSDEPESDQSDET